MQTVVRSCGAQRMQVTHARESLVIQQRNNSEYCREPCKRITSKVQRAVDNIDKSSQGSAKTARRTFAGAQNAHCASEALEQLNVALQYSDSSSVYKDEAFSRTVHGESAETAQIVSHHVYSL